MRLILIVFLGLLAVDLSAQRIFGTVKNEKGDPLPFASVTIKGTSKGTTANEKARYSIAAPSGGTITLICRHIGYAAGEKTLDVKGELEIDFVLKEQELVLNEVVITNNREDPAYEIIRNAIAKRSYYRQQVQGFSCEMYGKDKITLRSLPNKIFGQKIEETDKKDMGLDSAGKGIVYLSESLSNVYFMEPNKLKTEVISSRVSGSNSFGFTFPVFISLYDNNVKIFDQLPGSRGYISPIAEGALAYYKYKFLGTFWEEGRSVNAIRVTPRRGYEPLFSGVINITDDDWRIHSFDLFLSKRSQLELLDTLHITQLHEPVNEDVWRVKNQVIDFSFKILGISAGGKFLTVYSDYTINPPFKKNFFDRVVIKYDTAVSSRKKDYWDTVRPIVLEPEEQLDYRVKDSVFLARQEEDKKVNIDSLRKKQGPLKPWRVIASGIDRIHYGDSGRYNWGIQSLIGSTQYNPAEGLNTTLNSYFEKYLRKAKAKLLIIPKLRYGFGNTHFNPSLEMSWEARGLSKKKMLRRWSIDVAGGKRVSQFNPEMPITEVINTFSTLFYGFNFMKTYENYFFTGGWKKTTESGWKLSAGVLWEDRIPLNNTSNYTFNKADSVHISPNYPVELMQAPFERHQALVLQSSISFQPGQRYIQFPHQRVPIGSRWPTFSLSYAKGVRDLLGSDVDFDKWSFYVSDERNLGMPGLLKYKLGAGGFLNSQKVYAPDYRHFNGNQTWVASDYVNSFQAANYYQNSTTTRFYMIGHIEHHLNGLLTNKIPGFRKLKWNLVTGTNTFYVNQDNHYADLFVGLENIFKIFRIDWIASLYNRQWQPAVIRLGAGGLLGGSMNMSQGRGEASRSISLKF